MSAKFRLVMKNPLILLVIGFLLIISIIFISSSDVVYSIRITSNSVQQGENISLFYEVDNNLLFIDTTNVNFSYSLHNSNNQIVQNGNIEWNKISSGDKKEGYVIIKTDNLMPDEYTIWTDIHYWKLGHLEAKYLSLRVTIR